MQIKRITTATLIFIAGTFVPTLLIAQDSLPISKLDFASASGASQIWLVFFGGIASSLTPCVYPLIPITLALFGANGEIPRSKAFLLSICYVLGIATTYTALGILSASTGALFGSLLGNPKVVVAACLILIFLALCCLDVLPFRVAQSIQKWANNMGGKGYSGSYIMGTVSGVIAAPCVGPVLVLILGLAAASKDFIWGGVLLFAYSLGMGLLFILLGTFSGLISRVPRSGNWLLWVKLGLGSLILMVAAYLSSSFRNPFGASFAHEDRLYLLILILLNGVALGSIAFKLEVKLLRFFAALFIAFSSYELAFPPHSPSSSSPAIESSKVEKAAWSSTLEDAVKEAKRRNTVAMVDLFAEWCGACKELDAVTFPDPRVAEMLSKFALGRVDFTTDSEYTQKIQEKYDVIGLPCILFLNADGEEIRDSRVTGFLPPQEFLEHLNKVLK